VLRAGWRDRGLIGREPLGVEPGGQTIIRSEATPSRRNASAARPAVGEEQFSGSQHMPAEAAGVVVAIGREQWQRLPDRLDEAEAVAPAPASSVGSEPEAQLLGVDDVRVSERPTRGEVAVADDPDRHLAQRPPPGAGRATPGPAPGAARGGVKRLERVRR
jgi:hypothetical protein